MPRIKRPEQQIQRAVFQHLRQRGTPGVFAFHPANGGKRTKTEASILKGLGVVAGVPDVICIKGGLTYCLELKTNHGTVSASQEAILNLMHQAGATVAIAYGLDAALQRLEQWDLLRKDRVVVTPAGDE